jgi:hypothetical protein
MDISVNDLGWIDFHPIQRRIQGGHEMTTLNLTLKKAPFDVMVTGEKSYEIRAKSKWINSRLFQKDDAPKKYDYVKFTNGYGKNKPYFIAEFKGFKACRPHIDYTFSNGFHLETYGELWYIELGKIIEIGNLREVAQ